MNLSLCTISFRHQLTSLDSLARWAQANGFQGIELWGIHALNLACKPEPEAKRGAGLEAQHGEGYGADWLDNFGLRISMLSDYLPLDGDESVALAKVERLSALALHWGAPKLRTFAGQQGSAVTSALVRQQRVRRLRALCDRAGQAGLQLLVETHPNTLADTAASTRRLIEEVDHPALGINFDVLHVWEGGDDPATALALLEPWVRHFHLKNIRSRDLLNVFAPANVYAAAGSREGMVPLFEGEFDYRRFLVHLLDVFRKKDATSRRAPLEASLEWFGDNARAVLQQDGNRIRILERRHRAARLLSEAGAAVL